MMTISIRDRSPMLFAKKNSKSEAMFIKMVSTRICFALNIVVQQIKVTSQNIMWCISGWSSVIFWLSSKIC